MVADTSKSAPGINGYDTTIGYQDGSLQVITNVAISASESFFTVNSVRNIAWNEVESYT
jgi:hypothetical protein